AAVTLLADSMEGTSVARGGRTSRSAAPTRMIAAPWPSGGAEAQPGTQPRNLAARCGVAGSRRRREPCLEAGMRFPYRHVALAAASILGLLACSSSSSDDLGF